MRTLAPYKPGDTDRILEAQRLLRQARDLCAAAGAPQAMRAVNRALKSVDGALRHVEHRASWNGRDAAVRAWIGRSV